MSLYKSCPNPKCWNDLTPEANTVCRLCNTDKIDVEPQPIVEGDLKTQREIHDLTRPA